MMWVCMYNVWYRMYIICIWVWLYMWLYDCMSTWIYVIWCVILCEIIGVIMCGVMCVQCACMVIQCIWCDDLRLIYTCVLWSQDSVIYTDFRRAAWLEFLHVVLNTIFNCIICYVMLILMLHYVVMCICG